MKEFLLSKSEKDFFNKHTFVNPDENIKQQLKNFALSTNKVEFNGRTWKIVEWEDEEVRCEDKRDVHYFKVDQVKKALAEQEKKLRESLFDAASIFGEIYLPLYFIHPDNLKHGCHSVLKYTKNNKKDCIGTSAYYSFSSASWRLALDVSEPKDIDISVKFDENGDFEVYGYSQANIAGLLEFVSGEYDHKFMLQMFYNMILEFGEVKYCEKTFKFFKDDKCYTPEYKNEHGRLELRIESNEEGKTYRGVSYKLPKKHIIISAEEHLERIKSNMPDELVNYFK